MDLALEYHLRPRWRPILRAFFLGFARNTDFIPQVHSFKSNVHLLSSIQNLHPLRESAPSGTDSLHHEPVPVYDALPMEVVF